MTGGKVWRRPRTGAAAVLALAGAAAFGGGSAEAATAADGPQVLFILDASGSMWGRVEERPKMSIATEVMTDLVNGLDPATRAGLVAYGHRRKGDCSDVETVVPLGPLDAGGMTSALEAINPRGKTPIEGAVTKAVESVRHLEDPVTIVLVSDGLESCRGDPCQSVQAAKEAGVDFRMHVVGFDLESADTSELSCVAEAGGGRYFSAANAGELAGALEEAVAVTPELTIRTTQQAEPVDAAVSVRGGAEVVAEAQTGADGEAVVQVPPSPGRGYSVTATLTGGGEDQSLTVEDVLVREDRENTVTLNFTKTGLEVSATLNGAPAEMNFRLYDAATGEEVARRYGVAAHFFPAAAGTYRLESQAANIDGDPVQEWQGIELSKDEVLEKTFDFTPGRVDVSGAANGAPTEINFRIYDMATEDEVARRYGVIDHTFAVLPGTYRVEAAAKDLSGNPQQEWSGIEVGANETKSHVFDFSSGEVSVVGRVNGTPAENNFRVYDMATGKEVERRYGVNQHTFALQPGTYRLEIAARSLNGNPLREVKDLTVAAGSTQQVPVDFQGGTVSVKGTAGGAPVEMNFRVYDMATGKEVDRDYGETDTTFRLETGTYRIEGAAKGLKDNPLQEWAPVEVTAGGTLSHTFAY